MAKMETYRHEIKEIKSVAAEIKKTAGEIKVYDAAARVVRSSILTFNPGRHYTQAQREQRNRRYEEAGARTDAYHPVADLLPDLAKALLKIQKEVPKVKGAGSAFDIMIRIGNVQHAVSKLADAPDKGIAKTYREVNDNLKEIRESLKRKFEKVGLTENYIRTH